MEDIGAGHQRRSKPIDRKARVPVRVQGRVLCTQAVQLVPNAAPGLIEWPGPVLRKHPRFDEVRLHGKGTILTTGACAVAYNAGDAAYLVGRAGGYMPNVDQTTV